MKAAHVILILLVTFLSACSFFSNRDSSNYPMDPEDARRAKHGKLGGEDGIVLFGGGKGKSGSGENTVGIGVSSILWKAALDTVSFMPLASADPFGGVIITEWYAAPETPNERFKLNVYILDKTLRPDALRVTVFRQVKEGGVWQDAKTADNTARELEDRILTRAREIRVMQEQSN
jgi:hypothetical protein